MASRLYADRDGPCPIGTARRPAGLFTTRSVSSSYRMWRPLASYPALRRLLPGRSSQTRTVSPDAIRAPASLTDASASLKNTWPRSNAARTRPREPSRPGAARYRSSRSPCSSDVTVHCRPDVFTTGGWILAEQFDRNLLRPCYSAARHSTCKILVHARTVTRGARDAPAASSPLHRPL